MTETQEARLVWVACSIREFGTFVGEHAHLIVPGQTTTVCGNTATRPDIWRRNRTKPWCPYCLKASGRA